MTKELFSKETHSVEETENLGKELGKHLIFGDFVALFGDLGAGKTAFVRGLADSCCHNARISSPTYTIMHRHDGAIPFYHCDFYRIHSEEDLESVGFYDFEGIVAAEWCENVPFALPLCYYKVNIRKISDVTRHISIEKIENG